LEHTLFASYAKSSTAQSKKSTSTKTLAYTTTCCRTAKLA